MRQRPDDPARTPIRWVNGDLAGGIHDLPRTVAYLERELTIIEETVAEKRQDPRTAASLNDLAAASSQVLDLVEHVYFLQYPDRFGDLDAAAWRLKNVASKARRIERRLVWKKIW